MAKLVIIKNPFQKWNGREIKELPQGFTIREAIVYAKLPTDDIHCVLDGNTIRIDENYVIPNNSIITVSPVVAGGGGGVKNVFAVVAMVALSVVAMGAGAAFAGVAGQGLAAASGWAAVGGYLTAAAVMFVGSSLVGRLMGQNADLGNYGEFANNPTYSWNGVQTMEGQNNAIAMTYGTVKSGGQSISKYVDVKDNDEFLNWLVAAGEGPLTFSDIKINDKNLEEYSDITYETRPGTNEQSVISNFNDTYSTKAVSYQLLDNDVIENVPGNATQGIKVKIEFSGGLYYANDDGGLSNASVSLSIAYRKKLDDDTYTEWYMLGGGTVTDAKSGAIRKEYRVDNIEAGTYQVKVRVTGRSHPVTSSRAATRCWWTEVTSIVYDDFCYPNIGLIGIKAKATDQLSGSPSLTFLKTRSNVWVWNPNTEEYVQKPATNPAWAAYDMLHLASKLKNINTDEYEFEVRGVAAKNILYDQFEEWANFCDQKNLKINIEINTYGEMIGIINNKIAPCGRGMVLRFGTRFGCVWQCVKQPVQMFGMGNIIAGTFKEEFLPISDRANCVEITYNEQGVNNDLYERQTITIYSDNYDNDAEEKTAQATFDGITSYEQAYREGMFQLYCNKYLVRTVTFEANIDAIACTVGDVILVAHDVPNWSKSGRIYSVDVENNSFVLPIELEDTTKNYRIIYRTVNDNMYQSSATVVSSADGYSTVRCSEAFNLVDLPQENDIFDLALTSVGSKPFEVKSITRATDFTRTISCLEYNENIYNENYEIPEFTYSPSKQSIKDVSSLEAKRYRFVDTNGVYAWRLNLSWVREDAGRFNIYTSNDGKQWNIIGTDVSNTTYNFETTNYPIKVKVVTVNDNYSSDGVIVDIVDLNYVEVPYVSNLKAETNYRILADNQVQYSINVSWDKPLLELFLAGEVWYKTSNSIADKVTIVEGVAADSIGFEGSWTYAGTATDSLMIPFVALGDVYEIVVRSKYKNGDTTSFEDSPKLTYKVEQKTLIPNTPKNLKIVFGNVATISWDSISTQDLKHYEVGYLDNGNEVELFETSGNEVDVKLPSRKGVIYLYSVNTLNLKSQRVTLLYNKPKPIAPEIVVKTSIDNMTIELPSIPYDCISTNIYIIGTNKSYNKIISDGSTVATLTNLEADIYIVKASFVDIFGEGEIAQTFGTVEARIPSDLIDNESITIEKLSNAVQKAIKEGGVDTVNVAVKGLLGEGAALVLQPDGKYALVASDGTTLTGLFVDKSGTITVDGKYIHITGDTKFDNNVIVSNMINSNAVTADKMKIGDHWLITNDLIQLKDDNNIVRVQLGIIG